MPDHMVTLFLVFQGTSIPLAFFKVSEINSHLDLISRFLLKLHFKATCLAFVPWLFIKFLYAGYFPLTPRLHSCSSLLGAVPLEVDLQPELLGSIDLGFPWLGQWITSAGDSRQETTEARACIFCSLLLPAV